jgi:hypothetical protein
MLRIYLKSHSNQRISPPNRTELTCSVILKVLCCVLLFILARIDLRGPVPLAARSNSWLCDRSPAEIVGSNPTGGAWMSFCCDCCVLSGRGLCDKPFTRPEESYRLWCVIVCDLETSRMRRPWPTGGGGGAVAPKNKITKAVTLKA